MSLFDYNSKYWIGKAPVYSFVPTIATYSILFTSEGNSPSYFAPSNQILRIPFNVVAAALVLITLPISALLALIALPISAVHDLFTLCKDAFEDNDDTIGMSI